MIVVQEIQGFRTDALQKFCKEGLQHLLLKYTGLLTAPDLRLETTTALASQARAVKGLPEMGSPA